MNTHASYILSIIAVIEGLCVAAIIGTTAHMRRELHRRSITTDKHVDFAIKVRRYAYWLGTLLATATAVALAEAWQNWATVHALVTALGICGLFTAYYVSRSMQRTIEHRWTSELAEYLASLMNSPEAHIQRFSLPELMGELSGTTTEAKQVWVKHTMAHLTKARAVKEHPSPLGPKWVVDPNTVQQVMRELHRLDATS